MPCRQVAWVSYSPGNKAFGSGHTTWRHGQRGCQNTRLNERIGTPTRELVQLSIYLSFSFSEYSQNITRASLGVSCHVKSHHVCHVMSVMSVMSCRHVMSHHVCHVMSYHVSSCLSCMSYHVMSYLTDEFRNVLDDAGPLDLTPVVSVGRILWGKACVRVQAS